MSSSIPAYSKQYKQGKIASDNLDDIDLDYIDYDDYTGVDLEPPIYDEPDGPPMTDSEIEEFLKLLTPKINPPVFKSNTSK
jgi:hypothetical protein